MIIEPAQIPARAEIDLIGRLAAESQVAAHLVGGGLRDLILGRNTTDLDFALSGALREIPSRFAERVAGAFFWLDEERGHARVAKKAGGTTLTFDFTPERRACIEEDLAERDFTINALAWPLTGCGEEVIDPLLGIADIRRKLIRACASHSFNDDPLRLIRAVRFAATLGFEIESETLNNLSRNVSLIRQVAPERLRKEFFIILETQGIDRSLGLLCDTGLMAELLPGAVNAASASEANSALSLCIRTAANLTASLEQVSSMLERDFPDSAGYLMAYLDQELEGGITVLSIMKLAAILIECKADSAVVARRLRLGKKAGRLLALLCSEGGKPLSLLPAQTDRARYRFFRDMEPTGPAPLILAMLTGSASPKECAALIDYYCHKYSAAEELLLSGTEVMRILGIGPGKAVGDVMEQLKAAERLGAVNNRADAAAFLERNQLTNGEPIS
ncbi:MAG: CCA tRNA nucleotidyltransferase [Geobacteraceae bacterium]